jgi:hypothetical protein
MKMSHAQCCLRDLQAAADWFRKIWGITPVSMAVLRRARSDSRCGTRRHHRHDRV